MQTLEQSVISFPSICGEEYQKEIAVLRSCGEGFLRGPCLLCLGLRPRLAEQWKEQIQLDRIAQLEAKVQELELNLKR
jgi:hypothetical protein